MPVRIVRHEVEARLLSPTGERRGKSEYKVYGNGERRLTIRLRGLHLHAGKAVTVSIAGREWVRATPATAEMVYDVRTNRGDPVPEPRLGEPIEVRVDGGLAASGVYQAD